MLKLSETLGKPLGALLGNFILNEGGYVWAYATVLIGLLVASTYVCVIMSYHTWTTPKNKVNNSFNNASLKLLLGSGFFRRRLDLSVQV